MNARTLRKLVDQKTSLLLAEMQAVYKAHHNRLLARLERVLNKAKAAARIFWGKLTPQLIARVRKYVGNLMCSPRGAGV